MLDTVMQIGKTFRHSRDGFKYHRYIKSPLRQKNWEDTTFLSLSVKKDHSFDFSSLHLIEDENLKNDLYYLTYKTTEADNQVKYLFGDIFYSLSKGKESGYYKLPDLNNKQKSFHQSSFTRCIKAFDSMSKRLEEHDGVILIKEFRNKFSKEIGKIERIISLYRGIAEYLNSLELKDKISIEELLEDKNKLKQLNAKSVWKDIKKRKNSKTILTKNLDLGTTNWDEIKNDKNILSRVNNYGAGSLFLHFDFQGKQWYELNNITQLINSQLLKEFVEEIPIFPSKYILKKGLYKTLSTSQENFQIPSFSLKNRYKSKIFSSIDEIEDLFYAIDYSKTALIKIPYTNIKIIVLPKGNNLTSEDYNRFIEKKTSLAKEHKKENIIKQSDRLNQNSNIDMLFSSIITNGNENLTQFDLIISKQGEQNNPDTDLIELCGIEKSFINYISIRINEISSKILDRKKKDTKKTEPLSISRSYLNILEDKTKQKKRYQKHLYKVLPKIYSGTYYRDAFLLPAFISKVEQNIRKSELYYNSLKYDFYFLTTIQNTPTEGENLMKILESPSYKLGLSLGIISRPFASWKNDCPIKSFEKTYVGNLTRRVSSLNDLVDLKVDIDQKLIMHDKTYTDIKEASLKLTEEIKSFTGKFDKNECAFGFFESYFSFQKKNNTDSLQDNVNNN